MKIMHIKEAYHSYLLTFETYPSKIFLNEQTLKSIEFELMKSMTWDDPNAKKSTKEIFGMTIDLSESVKDDCFVIT